MSAVSLEVVFGLGVLRRLRRLRPSSFVDGHIVSRSAPLLCLRQLVDRSSLWARLSTGRIPVVRGMTVVTCVKDNGHRHNMVTLLVCVVVIVVCFGKEVSQFSVLGVDKEGSLVGV
eukprot:scaffold22930_cov73-Skeletonema_marinoi.AAC.1